MTYRPCRTGASAVVSAKAVVKKGCSVEAACHSPKTSVPPVTGLPAGVSAAPLAAGLAAGDSWLMARPLGAARTLAGTNAAASRNEAQTPRPLRVRGLIGVLPPLPASRDKRARSPRLLGGHPSQTHTHANDLPRGWPERCRIIGSR